MSQVTFTICDICQRQLDTEAYERSLRFEIIGGQKQEGFDVCDHCFFDRRELTMAAFASKLGKTKA